MQNQTRNYFLFIKIGKREHIERLRDLGEIYCNTIRYFRSVEDQRGDIHEGSINNKQIYNLKILHEGRIIGRAQRGQYREYYKTQLGNIFCLYGVESNLIDKENANIQKIKVDERNYEFGKSTLLITDVNEFLKRIKSRLNRMQIKYLIEPVTYYDEESYEGNLSPFHKPDKHSYQKEVRLFIYSDSNSVFKFHIGNIQDISYLISTSKLNTLAAKPVSYL